MKIGLLLSSNIRLSPYLEIFRKILNEQGVDFDVISWDRESLGETEGIVFNYPAPNTRSKLGKFIDYYKYSKFAKKVILENKYDKLIVFGAAIGVFMCDFLNKYYKNNFWLDYRDLTIEQKFMGRFKKLLDISSYISISSPGFKSVIPAGYDFILSHNFDIDKVRDALYNNNLVVNKSNPIVVSAIGVIRDYKSNLSVMQALANNSSFKIKFIGKGHSAEKLQYYVKENGIENVVFHGFYLKKDEETFYQNSNFINIYMPHIPLSSTLMSNRFYQALIFRKPMIVTKRSTQGDYVEKYGLGLSVEDCSRLAEQITAFISTLDEKKFAERCNELLKQFVVDYDNFEYKLLEYVRHE